MHTLISFLRAVVYWMNPWLRLARIHGWDMNESMAETCTNPWLRHELIHGWDLHESMAETCTNPWLRLAQIHGWDLHESMAETCMNPWLRHELIHGWDSNAEYLYFGYTFTWYNSLTVYWLYSIHTHTSLRSKIPNKKQPTNLLVSHNVYLWNAFNFKY